LYVWRGSVVRPALYLEDIGQVCEFDLWLDALRVDYLKSLFVK